MGDAGHVRQDARRHAGGLEFGVLFDVEFEPAVPPGGVESALAAEFDGLQCRLECRALVVGQCERLLDGSVTRRHRRAEQAVGEPGALLLGERHHLDGPCGLGTGILHRSHGTKRRVDAERPVEDAAVRHRVQVAAGGDGRRLRGGRRRRPPAGDVADSVQADLAAGGVEAV